MSWKSRIIFPAVVLVWALVPPIRAHAQKYRVNQETTISGVSIVFDDTQHFSEKQLLTHMASVGPGFWDRVKRFLPFLKPNVYPLNPVEVQRDVVRLRAFYRRNGFPHAQIQYARSDYDARRNRIRLVFAVSEGEWLKVSGLHFLAPDGSRFEEPATGRRKMFDAITVRQGDRYSEFQQVRTRDQALSWLKDHGYAFARIEDHATIDEKANTVDLRYTVFTGPVTYFGQIEVEGNESVAESVILRELPFKSGQKFSNARLSSGQRELFALNLFRTALTEVPEQPVDSTVHVRIRLREARPRLLTYQVGYGRESGLNLQGDWTHRNFFGSARSFSAGGVANTGFQAASTDRVAPRLFRGSLSMRQPYFFTTRLSATVSVFLQYRRDPQLPESAEVLGINEREMGLDTSVLFEMIPFRTLTLQYTWSRALQLSDASSSDLQSRDIFNRGNVTLSGVFGRTTDYIQGGTGFLVRPFVEWAQPALGSDVRYLKLGSELSGYREFLPGVGLAGRIFAGRLWPQGSSRDQQDPLIENRFDQIRFYTGGAADLRGWAQQLAGPKVVRQDISGGDTTYVYEAIGGLAKLAATVELRLPFPGLGTGWGTAVYIGGGRVSERSLAFDGFRFGMGVGIRYTTPVGLIRLDLAYKLNPDDADLRSARDFFLYGTDAKTDWVRRFALHLSIGQTF